MSQQRVGNREESKNKNRNQGEATLRQRLLADEIYLSPAPYDPHAGVARVLLVYPNTYHLGMSNLGLLYLYRLFNEHPDVACERAFYEAGLKERSFETASDIGKFDAILFTLPFETDVVNILRFLVENGIPPLAAARHDRAWPLVMVGGPVPTLNPRFLLPFADAVFVGDVEPAFARLAAAFTRRHETPRDGLLRELEDIPGIVTAQNVVRGSPIRRLEVDGPHECFATIATPNTEFSRTLLVEAERGCPFKCRFCASGFQRGRMIEMPAPKLAELAHRAQEKKLRLGLVGTALTSSSLWKNKDLWDCPGVELAFASLRADRLRPELLRLLARHQHSLTLAPEVGTPRMMELIDKGMDLRAALDNLACAKAEGIEQVKLYFMYGFPFELDEDLDGIVRFCEQSLETGLVVKVSLNPFIPKPQTPLQWLAMSPLKVLKEKYRHLRSRLHEKGVRDVAGYSPREAMRQAFIIFSDETDAATLMQIATDEKSVPDSSPVWSRVFQSKSIDHVFPWDVLQTATPKRRLWSAYNSCTGTS